MNREDAVNSLRSFMVSEVIKKENGGSVARFEVDFADLQESLAAQLGGESREEFQLYAHDVWYSYQELAHASDQEKWISMLFRICDRGYKDWECIDIFITTAARVSDVTKLPRFRSVLNWAFYLNSRGDYEDCDEKMRLLHLSILESLKIRP